jgi:hypothetical protein
LNLAEGRGHRLGGGMAGEGYKRCTLPGTVSINRAVPLPPPLLHTPADFNSRRSTAHCKHLAGGVHGQVAHLTVVGFV